MINLLRRLSGAMKRPQATKNAVFVSVNSNPAEDELISCAEAAKRLSVLDDKDWISWLADGRRGRHKDLIIPHVKGEGRRVWYWGWDVDAFVSVDLELSGALDVAPADMS